MYDKRTNARPDIPCRKVRPQRHQKRILPGVGGNDSEILRNSRWDEQIRIVPSAYDDNLC